MELLQVAEPPACALPEKDPYTLYVSLFGDEFNVYKRRRGILDGYYGAYTSLSIRDRAFSGSSTVLFATRSQPGRPAQARGGMHTPH